MTSNEIKSIRVNHRDYPMGAEDFVPYASRLIYRDQIIYPKPKISGYTIGEMLTTTDDITNDNMFILMSYDGIMLNSLKDGYKDNKKYVYNDLDKYIPLGEVKENSDVMIVKLFGTHIFYITDINGHKVEAKDSNEFIFPSNSPPQFASNASEDYYYYPCSKTSDDTKTVYWDTSYSHTGDVHDFYFYKLNKI